MTSSSLHEEEKQERRSRSRKLNEALRSKTNLSREGYHVALILTNSGSVARDHLASERTFLAYVRTSLALASTGVGECYCGLGLSFLCVEFFFCYSIGAVVYDCE